MPLRYALVPSKVICKQQWDVQLRANQDHTMRGRNKPQSCQSHFLSLGLLRNTFPSAEDGAFLEKHNTIDHMRRA